MVIIIFYRTATRMEHSFKHGEKCFKDQRSYEEAYISFKTYIIQCQKIDQYTEYTVGGNI